MAQYKDLFPNENKTFRVVGFNCGEFVDFTFAKNEEFDQDNVPEWVFAFMASDTFIYLDECSVGDTFNCYLKKDDKIRSRAVVTRIL